MEFKEGLRIIHRMCAEYHCEDCPLDSLGNKACIVNVHSIPDKAEAIITEWAEEHPERTIADDFIEKHPKAPKYADGTPLVCAEGCGYEKPSFCDGGDTCCLKCWLRPLEEVE